MKILIVEDERVAARRLERLTKEILQNKVTSIRCVETLDSSKYFVSQHEIDLLLLDLNLNGEDGFQLLQTAVAQSFHTIVVSANTDRALEAFEYGVLDFVPKPFEKERFQKALQRIENAYSDSVKYTKVLVVKSQGRLQLIPVEHILYLKGAGDYAELHLTDGGIALHNKSLENLEKILPPRFVRVHRSYIADFNEIKNMHIHGGGKYEAELKNGIFLPVSRTRYKELYELLTKAGKE